MNTDVLENLELSTEELLQQGKATGQNVSEDMVNYTLLNQRRMKRLDKTLKIDQETTDMIKGYAGKKVTWLVLTESWCGDAAQALPMINKVASLTENISLKLILRDENIDVMNRFLTNGAMSIPKLVMVDDASGKVVGEWGSRPKIAQQMVVDYKNEHGTLTPEFKEDLQVWYNKDKGQSMLNDLLELLALK